MWKCERERCLGDNACGRHRMGRARALHREIPARARHRCIAFALCERALAAEDATLPTGLITTTARFWAGRV